MRHLVIQNPSAGRRRGRDPEAVEEAFRSRNLDFDLALTERAGHASRIVAERGSDYDAVVVVGGDGTLHEVLQTLDLSRHRLGVIPWGTGNDFAWLHGWTADLDTGLDRIAAGKEQRIDVGTWEARCPDGTRSGRFHNSLGLGFEALVNAESHRVQKIKGPLVYLVALARSLPRYRNYSVRIESDDGVREDRTTLLSVAIGPRVGGCFHMAPDADPTDGLLDLVHAGEMNLMQALMLLPGMFSGKHVKSPRVRVSRSRAVSIAAEGGIPAYVDGEFIDYRVEELVARVEPGALRMFQ
jgi:YegS/Rv2252/BmrU family lipid kinase